jgi:peptide/nickel transport system substrate-binding protein
MLRKPPLTLLVALMATMACTSGARPPRPDAAAAGYHAVAPVRPGGTVVLADFEAPQTLTPLTARTDVELRAATLLFAPLWGLGPGLEPYPDLARRVPTPANGDVRTARAGRSMTVDVRLVPGLEWSDGEPVTADDVIFTWTALHDPALRPLAPAGLDRIVRMDRRSPTEVLWTFDGVDAAYVQLRPSGRRPPSSSARTWSPGRSRWTRSCPTTT